jgi:predicted aldo/keto reductase-like oxidoreductase
MSKKTPRPDERVDATTGMRYRRFGAQGPEVSLLGFGGMRFVDIDDEDACAQLVVDAYDAGVNYFDTAPGYFGGRSEERFGLAFRQLRSREAERPFHVATKSTAADADGVRRDLERSLERLGRDHVDFFHVWWVVRPEAYFERKAKGALDEFSRIKEQGLARHIVLSSHMSGAESEAVLADYPFDGILVGYSALHAAFRERSLEIAARGGRGVVVMNPLAGGAIPQHAERFAFLRGEHDESVTCGALRFLIDDPRISVVLVGLGERAHLDEALTAVRGYRPFGAERREAILRAVSEGFEELCTGCGYCDSCPEGLALPRLMQGLDARLFSDEPKKVENTLRYGHGLPPQQVREQIARCNDCGHCEPLCTQKLPIVARLGRIDDELSGGSR